ncbi:hypothetical protein F7U66_00180 [Vibrio parahaemolyticus]|nr:hypothetical protein [Vibrio parahaemolyticus]
MKNLTMNEMRCLVMLAHFCTNDELTITISKVDMFDGWSLAGATRATLINTLKNSMVETTVSFGDLEALRLLEGCTVEHRLVHIHFTPDGLQHLLALKNALFDIQSYLDWGEIRHRHTALVVYWLYSNPNDLLSYDVLKLLVEDADAFVSEQSLARYVIRPLERDLIRLGREDLRNRINV